MFEVSIKKTLLLLLLIFSFAYRLLLMTGNIFPPGSDIGLHQSVINSISISNSNFFINHYHMGGGISATNPGYHLFVTIVANLTGATDYLVHAVIVSFFSAVTVLCVFLIVRRVWSESAAYIAAFLVTFSEGDILMLCWGGYPNIIALFLIPVLFYLYLQYDRFSQKNYLLMSSLLVAALFLTHVFSAIVFVAIIIVTLIVTVLFSIKSKLKLKQIATWILPIVFGTLLISSYLFVSIPLYFSPESTITGNILETKQSILATRLIPIEYVVLSIVPVFLFFVFSKYYKGRYFIAATILFAAWTLIPAMLTQSYLLDVFLDYERFQYFLYFPIIVSIALLIESGSRIFSQATAHLFNMIKQKTVESTKSLSRVREAQIFSRRIFYLLFVFILLFSSLFYLPMFTTPTEGFDDANFFQVMTPSKFDAIQWIKTNTDSSSVLVADAEYGWWLSGFAQRPTLSAVNPQFLILAHEIMPAQIARNILASDYFIDNGIIRINYYKSDTAKNNFDLTTQLNSSTIPYPFFSIMDKQISLLYRKNNTVQHLSFTDLSITNIHVRNGSNWAEFTISMENHQLVFSESVTIHEGVRFAKVTMNFNSKVENISLNWLHIPFRTQGSPIQSDDTIGFVDSSITAVNQLIFPIEQQPSIPILQENPNYFELVHELEGKPDSTLEFYVGCCPYLSSENINELIENNTKTYHNSVTNIALTFFDYQTAIKSWNVSYVVISDSETSQRFMNDIFFKLVYKNDDVSIYEVNDALNN